jgi:hypothetical protein
MGGGGFVWDTSKPKSVSFPGHLHVSVGMVLRRGSRALGASAFTEQFGSYLPTLGLSSYLVKDGMELCWLKLGSSSNNKNKKCYINLPASMHFFLYFITWSRQPGNLNEIFYTLEKVFSIILPCQQIYIYTCNTLPEHSRCETANPNRTLPFYC